MGSQYQFLHSYSADECARVFIRIKEISSVQIIKDDHRKYGFDENLVTVPCRQKYHDAVTGLRLGFDTVSLK